MWSWCEPVGQACSLPNHLPTEPLTFLISGFSFGLQTRGENPIPQRLPFRPAQTRPMKSLAKLLLAGAAVLVLAVVAALLFKPKATMPPLPVPNGLDDLMRAASSIQPWPGGSFDTDPKTPEERLSLLASNAPALEMIRTGLARAIRLPTTNDLTSSLALDQAAALKRVARLVAIESRSARDRGDATNALGSALTLFDLSNHGTKGGLVIHGLVGVAIRSMACRAMEDVLGLENAAVCRMAAQSMFEKATNAPTAADFISNEWEWRRTLPIGTQLGGHLVELMNGSARKSEEKFIQRVDQQRQIEATLVRDLAAAAFRLEHGRTATNWTELVPAYLPEIPRNATNNTPLPLGGP